jgi:hypothetical protein
MVEGLARGAVEEPDQQASIVLDAPCELRERFIDRIGGRVDE